jgi:predicted transcriptional regulator
VRTGSLRALADSLGSCSSRRVRFLFIASPDDHADFETLRALRAAPKTGLAGLADALGVPRSTFGRRLDHHLLEQVTRLVEKGLVEQDGRRYCVSQRGRDLLAERAFKGTR